MDQFGRDQSTGPGIADGKNVWEHRIIGLSSTAPGPLGKHGIVFTGGTPGTFTVYLDNLRIRHADGSTTPLWTGRKDTRPGRLKPSELFKDLRIRTVDVTEIARSTARIPWAKSGEHPAAGDGSSQSAGSEHHL
ncbi:MAG: hypothetical protein D6766_13190 [Verrucomicrobia bacterium]|nr:MAG: hypothetical protein D6766_13190 [Verrucomicrobiota bacterium]